MLNEVCDEIIFQFPKFHATLYHWCNYFSIVALKLNHVSKRGPGDKRSHDFGSHDIDLILPEYFDLQNQNGLCELLLCCIFMVRTKKLE